MSAYNYFTKDGYDKLMDQIEYLKTTERQRIAGAIAEAREKGDLSENAEYKAAKDEQGMLEMKLSQLEGQLATARILDETQIDTSQVSLLTSVTIKNVKTKKEVTYTIVPEAEADLKTKRISFNSPVGQGLLAKKIGEIAQVTTPRGIIEFEILNITL